MFAQPLVRTGTLSTSIAPNPEGFQMSGWEFVLTRDDGDIGGARDCHPVYAPSRQSVQVSVDVLVHQDLWPAFKSMLEASLGHCGPYRLEKPGMVITGLAVAQCFRAAPCSGREFGFPRKTDPKEWHVVRVDFQGLDSDEFGPVYTASPYQLSLVEKPALPG